MKFLRVSKRYAKALLNIALENNIQDKVYEDMQLVFQTFASSPDLRVFMKSPIIRETKKVNVLHSVFENKLNPYTLKYLDILTRKNRAVLIQPIAMQFDLVYCDHFGIEKVKVIAAAELDDKLKNRIFDVARKITDKKILIEENIDKSIIGGFVLNVGGYQYNASLKKRLTQLRKHLGY
ncbi:MAG: ATP synthase F1 subunit delta [Bacteroidetes bacterium]|nr:ATP synthase F1 subunit delta [Bacteroidota bacterium]